MAISYINGAECPKCHSYMKFRKAVYLLQTALLVLIPASIGIIFNRSYLFGSVLLIAILTLSFAVNYFAKYEIDPAHKARLNRGGRKVT